MMENNEEKKKLFYIIVLLLTFVVMIIGATAAYFSLISSQKDEETKLYTGRLDIDYIDGVYIKNPSLWPMSKPNYNTYDEVYRNNFAVKSSGTLDQTISLDLKVNVNEFKENTIKYILFNDKGVEMSSGTVPQEGKINLANNLFLASNGYAKYTLMIWMYNLNYNQNDEMGKTFTGQIFIESKQMKY